METQDVTFAETLLEALYEIDWNALPISRNPKTDNEVPKRQYNTYKSKYTKDAGKGDEHQYAPYGNIYQNPNANKAGEKKEQASLSELEFFAMRFPELAAALLRDHKTEWNEMNSSLEEYYTAKMFAAYETYDDS